MKYSYLYIIFIFTTSLIFCEPIFINIKTPYGSITCADYNTLEDIFQKCRQNFQCDRIASIKLYIGNKEVLEGSEFARKTRLRDFDNKEQSEAYIIQQLPTNSTYPTHHKQYYYPQNIIIPYPNNDHGFLECSPDMTFAQAFAICRNQGLYENTELVIAFHKNGKDCHISEYDSQALQTFQQILGSDIEKTKFIFIQLTSQNNLYHTLSSTTSSNTLDSLDFLTKLFLMILSPFIAVFN